MAAPLFRSRLFRTAFLATSIPAGLTLIAAVLLTDSGFWTWVALASIALASALAATALWIRPIHLLVDEFREFAAEADTKTRTQGISRPLARLTRPTGDDELHRAVRAVESLGLAACERVDDLERRQKELEQDFTLLEGILATMQEGVVVVDSRELLRYVNVAGRVAFDVASREAVGRYAWESIRNSALQEIVDTVRQQKIPIRREIEIPRRRRIVAISAVPLPDELGEGVLAVAHDVTELRKLETMRREFVSNVSHELKTPLTSIQAYTETLLDGAMEDAANNRTFLQQILQQTERLQTLILDMLRLARIESEPEAFEIVPVAVAGLIRECLTVHAPIADQAGVTLSAREVEGDLQVLADADGLRTILNNLVRNAIHSTHRGGSVEIVARPTADVAEIFVQDTGVGISREHLARIFERFYRVDKARTRGAGGTGLGLAIVKHLTEVFHGEVSVESELGRGSRFTVRLPLTSPSLIRA